ncbi:MAG: rhodanese-like domain-containing protein [Blastocatellia bacterium]
MRYDRLILLFVLALMLAAPVAAQTADDRITIEQLKRKLDAKEKTVIIDARAGGAWVGSTVKIKGARHITLDDLEAKMKTLPKNREVVVYCA